MPRQVSVLVHSRQKEEEVVFVSFKGVLNPEQIHYGTSFNRIDSTPPETIINLLAFNAGVRNPDGKTRSGGLARGKSGHNSGCETCTAGYIPAMRFRRHKPPFSQCKETSGEGMEQGWEGGLGKSLMGQAERSGEAPRPEIPHPCFKTPLASFF